MAPGRCIHRAFVATVDVAVIGPATPAGAADLLAENLPLQVTGLLFDVIYKPWPTVLASAWSDRSGKVINGKELLLWQGLDQLSLVLSQEIDRDSISTHLRKVLSQL